MFAVGCQNDKTEDITNAKPTVEKKLNVVATISMITDIVHNVGGTGLMLLGLSVKGLTHTSINRQQETLNG